MSENKNPEEPKILDEVLAQFGNSPTEFAKALTKANPYGEYYSPQRVNYWQRVDQIPPEHVAVVAKVTGISPSRIRPDLFAVFAEKGAPTK